VSFAKLLCARSAEMRFQGAWVESFALEVHEELRQPRGVPEFSWRFLEFAEFSWGLLEFPAFSTEFVESRERSRSSPGGSRLKA
jgi:hypothetical protein